MTNPTGIDGDAPVLARHEILVQAPIETIWDLHIAVNAWTSSGLGVASTIYDVSPPTGDVSPRARTLWGGTAQGITGIHECTFTDMTQGVLVSTNESQAGAPVDGDPSTMQDLLDASLVSWLLRLKGAAESRA